MKKISNIFLATILFIAISLFPSDEGYCRRKGDYAVIYLGTSVGTVKTMKVLKRDLDVRPYEAKMMYKDPPGTIKHNLTLEKANKLKSWLEKRGILSEIRKNEERPELSAEYLEKIRKKKEPTFREKAKRSKEKYYRNLIEENILKVKNIKFYEWGGGDLYRDKREYASKFPKSSRYIYTEVTFENTLFGKELPDNYKRYYTVDVLYSYYYPSGRKMGAIRDKAWVDIEQNKLFSTEGRGWGYKKGGKWKPGTYTVKISIPDGDVFAEGEYVIEE